MKRNALIICLLFIACFVKGQKTDSISLSFHDNSTNALNSISNKSLLIINKKYSKLNEIICKHTAKNVTQYAKERRAVEKGTTS